MKSTATNSSVRDDSQGAAAAITATAAGTGLAEVRPSVFRRLSMSMGSRKSSMFPVGNQPRPNTYRMEPDNDYRFRPYRIQPKVLEILVEQLKDKTYGSTNMNELAKDISRSVHQFMKQYHMPRYRMVVQTVIGQKCEQQLRIVSRCLWDANTDNMISVNCETQDLVGVVIVFGVYLD